MRSLLLALVVLVAAGCGGGGGAVPPSAFAGQYSGTWQELSEIGGQGPIAEGAITFVISEKGEVSGLFSQTTPTSRNGNVAGKVKPDGTLSFSVGFPGAYTGYSGNMEKMNGALDGSFAETGVGYGGFFPFYHLEPSDL